MGATTRGNVEITQLLVGAKADMATTHPKTGDPVFFRDDVTSPVVRSLLEPLLDEQALMLTLLEEKAHEKQKQCTAAASARITASLVSLGLFAHMRESQLHAVVDACVGIRDNCTTADLSKGLDALGKCMLADLVCI